MRSVIKNLCWKEFHELKWGTVAAAAIVLAIPLCYVFRDLGLAFMGVHTGLWVYPILAGIFFGMRASVGERTTRAASFVAALPVSHRLLGAVRLASAFTAAAAPPVSLLLLGMILSPLTEEITRNGVLPLVVAFGCSILGTVCCISIVAVAGLGQPTEVRAAVVGFAAIIGTWILCFLATMSAGIIFAVAEETAFQWFFASGAICSVVLVVVLAGVFTARYPLALGLSVGRSEGWREIGDWIAAVARSMRIGMRSLEMGIRSLQAGRRSPLAALAWKGAREMGVLGVQVFLVSLLLSFAAGALGLAGNDPKSVAELVTKALPVILWVGGFVLAILIGVGAVIGDLQPGVNTFWRSRPISPLVWYWTKYGIGLATILVAIEIPFLLSANSYGGEITDNRGVFWWPLIWNVTFSFALTATCLIRQPAHAAILAVGAAGVLYSVIEAAFGSFTPGESHAPLIVLVPVFLVAFVVSTFVGSWAAKHDVAIS